MARRAVVGVSPTQHVPGFAPCVHPRPYHPGCADTPAARYWTGTIDRTGHVTRNDESAHRLHRVGATSQARTRGGRLSDPRPRWAMRLSGAAAVHAGSVIGARAAYAARAGRAVLADPYAGCERVLDRLSERRERHRAPFAYAVTDAWHEHLHAALGMRWPCAAEPEIDAVWRATHDDMTAGGLVAGRGTFGGWDDGGRALVAATYCLVRHLRPERVVDTGVAHGVTTRFTLEALERNGAGRLWSIDLPPLIDRHLESEVGVAVPERLRGRWTLVRGSSRQRLRPLLAALGTIGVFVHDSMHTTRNVHFELAHDWPALTPGGVVVADDIDFNRAFGTFTPPGGIAHALVGRHEDTDRLFGVLVKATDRMTTGA